MAKNKNKARTPDPVEQPSAEPVQAFDTAPEFVDPAVVESEKIDAAVEELQRDAAVESVNVVPTSGDVGQVPSIEQVLAEGYSETQASSIVAGLQALADGPAKEEPFVGYRVVGAAPRGFWAVGRKFAPGDTINIPIEELSEANLAELDTSDPRHLIVSRIGLD